MSEDIPDGNPFEEKSEVMEMPSNDVLPHDSVPHLVEAEISHESSQDEHEQVTQSISDRQEGDILINENPLTEKLVESLPSSEETTEDVPTECIETVSLDAEPELEETVHEQSPAADSSSKASRWGAWGTWGKSLLSSASATVGSGSDQEQLGKHLKPDVYKAAVPPVFLFPGIYSIDRLPDPGIRVGLVSVLLSNNFECNFVNLFNKIDF